MCCEHEDEEPQKTLDPKGHKRNLSNGSANDSPVRRSKRQRSSTNLKELSSSDESEADEDFKPPAKAKQTKTTQTKASTKKAASDVKTVCRESAEIKAEEPDAPATTQKAKPAAKRGKKTKEQKETEAMPLAPRTKGLKMLVGAHVSAAKGVFNAIHNSEHIGYASLLETKNILS